MIASIVVCYHPDGNTFVSNLLSYSHAVDKVLVWRNSPEQLDIPESLKEKVIFLGTGENQFMAKPLNVALDWCEANGYDYLLTMDQDSQWVNAAYFIQRTTDQAEVDVAVYSPYVSGQYAKPDADYDAETVITSGSLVNVRIAKKLGGYREDYQIYWVDSEYCYWARHNGYRIRVLYDCELKQKFGHQTKTLFGFMTSNYSPLVYYFIIRNMLWMHREFPEGANTKCVLYTLMYNIRGIVLGEKNKLKKLHKINCAIFSGLFGKFEKRKAL